MSRVLDLPGNTSYRESACEAQDQGPELALGRSDDRIVPLKPEDQSDAHEAGLRADSIE